MHYPSAELVAVFPHVGADAVRSMKVPPRCVNSRGLGRTLAGVLFSGAERTSALSSAEEHTCNRCEQVLPLTSFQNRRKHGWKCTDCVTAHYREYRQANRDRITAATRERYALDPERFRQEKRESTARNKDATLSRNRKWWAEVGSAAAVQKRLEDPRAHRDRHLRSRYGISLAEYEEMSAKQGGRCAICHEVTEVLCVDHCHDTGAVRSLLCNTCNAGIGYLKDDALLAYRAAHYLLGEVGEDGLTPAFG